MHNEGRVPGRCGGSDRRAQWRFTGALNPSFASVKFQMLIILFDSSFRCGEQCVLGATQLFQSFPPSQPSIARYPRLVLFASSLSYNLQRVDQP